MRNALTLLGLLVLWCYAVIGAFLMNDWAVVAASHLPLGRTVAAMDAAEQPYGWGGGIVFATFGALLAVVWAVLTLMPRIGLPGWASTVLWSAILACGAPAYFFFSFGNMNSVGDTFYDWDAEAAFALELPLYLISGAAAVVCVGALIAPLGGRILRRTRPAVA